MRRGAVEELPTPTEAGGDELDHLYCCDENLGLCGTDLSAHEEIAGDMPEPCIVCEDLDTRPCETCGWDE